MAAVIPLKVVQGTVSQLGTTDELAVLGVDARVAGPLTLGGTTATTVTVGGTATTTVNVGADPATAAINIGTGYTLGAGLISIGTAAGAGSRIDLGNAATEVRVPGTLTVTTSAEFDGNTIIGDGAGPDTLTVNAAIVGNLTFQTGFSHSIGIALSAGAGGVLSLLGGEGATTGGNLTLDGGVGGSGVGGDVILTGGTGSVAGGISVVSDRVVATEGAALSITQSAVTVGVLVGAADPIVAGAVAPLGSLYHRSNGSLYVKIGAGSSGPLNWAKVETGTGGSASLQTAYVNGQTIAVTTVPVGISSNVAAVDALSVLTTDTGTALTVNTTTSTGDALQVQVGGTPVITVDSTGTVSVSGKNDGVFGSGVTISAGDGVASTGAGGAISLKAGAGYTSGAGAGGGSISLTAGDAATDDNGGTVNITAGNNDFAGAGTPGEVNIGAGNKTDAVGTGLSGGVYIASGSNAGTGDAADITLQGGANTSVTSGKGGNILLTGGASTADRPGAVVISSDRSADATSPTAGPALTITQTGASGATASIFAGTLDPNATVVVAPEGSLYLRDAGASGELWIKTAGAVWTQASVAGATSLQTAYNTGRFIAVSGAATPVEISSAVASTALLVNTTSSGSALQVQASSVDVLVVNQFGKFNVTAGDNGTVGSDVFLTAGAGVTGVGGTAALIGGVSVAAADAGAALLTGGANSFAGAGLGGAVTITGGAKTSASATAGAGEVTITGGANTGTASSAAGGSVNITGGAVVGVLASAGTVTIKGGASAGANGGAYARLIGGDNTTGPGGAAVLQGGASTSNTGGQVQIQGGASTSAKPGATKISTDRSATNTTATKDGAVLTLSQTGTNGVDVDMFAGDIDPRLVSGVVATLGSTYYRNVGGTSGEVYVKTGTLDTDWSLVSTGGVASLQKSYNGGNTIAVDLGLPVTISSAVADTALIVNTTSTGDALRVQSGGTSVITVSDVGAVTVLGKNNGSVGSAVSITAGASAGGAAGVLTLVGGASTATAGGAVNITGGSTTAVASAINAGGVNITGGTTASVDRPGGQVSLTGGASTTFSGGSATVSGGASTVAGGGTAGLVGGQGTSGGSVSISGGSATTTTGGVVNIAGGSSPTVAGVSGGAVTVRGGDVAVASATGTAGAATIRGGNVTGATTPTGNAGAMTVSGGGITSATGTGTAGALTLNGGDGAAASGGGGNTTLRGGDVTNTAAGILAGTLTIRGGNTSSTTAVGANVSINGGNAASSSGVGGEIVITGGTSSTGKPGAMTVSTPRSATNGAVAADGPVLTLTQTGTSGTTESVFVGTADPSATSGVVANKGSLYLRNSTLGELWIKQDGLATDWKQLATVAGSNLQAAYVAGAPNSPAITVTDANGSVALEAAPASLISVLKVTAATTSTAPAVQVTNSSTAGSDGIRVDMASGSTGVGISIVSAAGTGTAFSSQVTGGGGVAGNFAASNTGLSQAAVHVSATGTGTASGLWVESVTSHPGATISSVDGTGLDVDSTGTGAIAIFRDSGAAILTLTTLGAITAAPTANAAFTVDTTGTGTISLDAAATSNFSTSAGSLNLLGYVDANIEAATGDVNFKANGAPNLPVNSLADPILVGFTAGSIVGALNELKVGTTSASQIVQSGFDTATLSVTNGLLGYLTTTANRVGKAIATSLATSMVFGANEGTVNSMTTAGTIDAQVIETAITVAAGDRLFLSAADTGAVTNVPPSAAGQVILPVGFARTAGSGAGGTVPMLLAVGAPVLLT